MACRFLSAEVTSAPEQMEVWLVNCFILSKWKCGGELFCLVQEAQNRHINVKHGRPWNPGRSSRLPTEALPGPGPHDTSHSEVRRAVWGAFVIWAALAFCGHGSTCAFCREGEGNGVQSPAEPVSKQAAWTRSSQALGALYICKDVSVLGPWPLNNTEAAMAITPCTWGRRMASLSSLPLLLLCFLFCHFLSKEGLQ